MYEDKSASAQDAKAVKQLPHPKGYKVLIAMMAVKEKTEGGVIRPDKMREDETTASIVGYVMDLGPDCYGDAAKFPNGPFCKKGDFVIFRSYSGTRFKIHGSEFRLINDDTIEAVVDDPRGYERV